MMLREKVISQCLSGVRPAAYCASVRDHRQLAWAGCIAEAVDGPERAPGEEAEDGHRPGHLRQIQMDRLLLLIHIGRKRVGKW